jgi:hypothetical protein
MNGWMDGKSGRRETGKREGKYAQKIKKQRNINIEKENINAIFYISLPNIQYSTNQCSSFFGLERLSSGKVSERINTRDAFRI